MAEQISNLRYWCSSTGTAYYLQTRFWEEDCRAQSPTQPDASRLLDKKICPTNKRAANIVQDWQTMSARFRRLSASFALCVARLKISSNGLPENQAEQSYYV